MDQALSLSLDRKRAEEFCIQSIQDGLFFGRELLRGFLRDSQSALYHQDGDCLFKEQICARLCFADFERSQESLSRPEGSFRPEDLLSLVSYLSGAYTLLSCWTERSFSFDIMACPTPGFVFSSWEEKAILKAGAFVQKAPDSVCSSLAEASQALEGADKKPAVLNGSKIPKAGIKDFLRSSSPLAEISLQGDFAPSDLEEFREFRLKSVYPDSLQGYFPRLEMRIV